MTTNKQLREWLKQFPDDAEVVGAWEGIVCPVNLEESEMYTGTVRFQQDDEQHDVIALYVDQP